MIRIRSTDDPTTLSAARRLIRSLYHAGSNMHDDAEVERIVAALPAPYTTPLGTLWVAWRATDALGCAAIQEIGPRIAELKRMYVRPEVRGFGVGRFLTEHAIACARVRGYARIRLGTLVTSHAAQKLYESYGFRRIKPYREAEFGGTVFYELAL
jgi:putative acetyltransferase